MKASILFAALAFFTATSVFAAKLSLDCSQGHHTFAIKEKSRQADGEGVEDLKLTILVTNEESGDERRYGNSHGWLKEDGEFHFSLCNTKGCSGPSLHGKIVGNHVRGGEVIHSSDTLASAGRKLSCKVQ